jgi:hypothetical protein
MEIIYTSNQTLLHGEPTELAKACDNILREACAEKSLTESLQLSSPHNVCPLQ